MGTLFSVEFHKYSSQIIHKYLSNTLKDVIHMEVKLWERSRSETIPKMVNRKPFNQRSLTSAFGAFIIFSTKNRFSM